MRAIGTAAAGLAMSAVAWGQARAEPQRYVIDPDHFSISFEAVHIGFAPVLGMFLQASGGFAYDEEARELSDLTVTVDALSVFTNHERRDEHLRGGDFLAADEHPEVTFVMTEAEATGEDTGVVRGDLTLRGETRPVEVQVTLNKASQNPITNAHTLGLSATATVKRSEFGSTYAVDNGWVADEIPLRFEMEAVRQE